MNKLSVAGIVLGLVAAALVVLFLGAIIGTIIVLLAMIVVLVMLIKTRGTDVGELEDERGKLKAELREAEKRFMRHRMNEKAYKELRLELQARLVGVEAAIQAKKLEKTIGKEVKKQAQIVDSRLRHKLKDLLKEKEVIMKKLALTQQKYYKRKIDANTYRDITAEQQKRLLEIDVEIKGIYREEAKGVMKQTERELAKSEEKREAESTKEIAEAIFEQLKEEDDEEEEYEEDDWDREYKLGFDENY